MYILSDLALKIIKGYRGTEEETLNSRSKLGFNQNDIIMTKEKSVTTKIMKPFPNEKISLQPNVLEKNLYFAEDKLAIEIDEKGHTDRPKKKEEEREKKNTR